MGCVYIMKGWVGPNFYKIGSTRDLNKRWRTKKLRSAIVLTIETDNPSTLEREIHTMFQDKRIGQTEAFALTDADIETLRCQSVKWDVARKPSTATKTVA